MRRALKIGSIVLLVLLAVVGIGIYVVSGTDFGRERTRRFALGILEDKVNGNVRIGRIEGNLLRRVRIHDISITDSAGEPFIVADEVRSRYGLFSLASKKILLRDLTLVRPVIVLDRKPGGEWNFQRIFAQAPDTTPQDTTAGWGDWIAFRNVTIEQGRMVVRMPWRPDTALTAAQQDSVVERTLAGESRNRVQRVAGGFQKVMTFDRIDAKLPTVRLADPDEESRLIRFASAKLIAAPFAPPVIDIRDVQGTFEFTGDSLWFEGARVKLPGSRIAGGGRYAYESSDMMLRLKGEQVATADLRWLYPRLPSNGGGSLDFAMDWEDGTQRYVARNADVRIGGARAQGTFGITLGDSMAFHDTDLRIASLDTRLIEQMVPNLTLPRRGTLSGRVAANGGIHAMQVNADVAFADERAGTSRAIMVGEVGAAEGGGIRARNLRVRAEAVQMALLEAFSSELPVDGVISGTATIDGTTATRLVAVADLTHTDRGAVSRLTGRGALRLAGGMWMDVDVQARPISLLTAGRFVPALGLQGSAVGPLRLTGTLRDLRLDSKLAFQDGGALDLEGRFDFASAQKGYDVAAAMRLFNAHLVMAKAPRTSLTARASVRGRGFDPKTMTLAARADVEASEYDSLAIDSAGVRVSIANGLLHAERIQLSGSRAVVTASGTFGLVEGRSGEIVFRGQADSLARFARWLPRDTGMVAPRPARVAQAKRQAKEDSVRIAEATAVERAVTGAPMPKVAVDTPPSLRRDSIAGRVQLAGSLRGGLERFDARARLAAEGLAVGGNTAKAARGEVAWTGAMTPQSKFAAALQLDAATAGGFALDSVDLRATYARRAGTASVAVWQDKIREYSVAGDYVLHLDHKEVHLGSMALRFDTSTWTATRPSTIKWGVPGIEIVDLDIRDRANGRIYADGLLPTDGSRQASLRFAIDNFAVENIAGLMQEDMGLAGLVSVNGAAQGTLRSPRFRVAYGVSRASYRGTRVPEMHGTMTYADRSLVARMTAARDGGQPMATLEGQMPINLSLQMGEGEQRLGNGPISIDLVADSLPLELIPKFTDAVADVRGRAAGKIVVRGTVRQPVLAGALALDRGHMRLVSTGMRLQNIAGFIRMRDDTVFIDSIAARAGGPVRLAGTVAMETFSNPVFNLEFFTQNARVLDNELGRLRADAELTMAGPFSNAYISGRSRVRSGVIYLPESDGKSVISAGDPALFNVVDTAVVTDREVLPTQSPLLAGLRMDVTLHVSRNTWVRSQEANVEIYTADDGLSVHVDRAKQTLAMEGVVSTDNGQYTFLTKRFQIRNGSAMFIGNTGPAGEALNPTLQVTGEYEVQQASREALNIRVIIGGTLKSPKLSLESDAQPPIPQSDLLSYLAFGRSSSSLIPDAGGSSTSGGTTGGSLVGTSAQFAYKRLAGVAVGVLADELEGDVSRSIGADILNITPADVPEQVYTPEGIGSLIQGTEFEVGKYVDSRTFVSVQARLGTQPGVRVARRTSKGFIYEASFEPRFPVVTPSLEPGNDVKPEGVFGLFLIREWRF